MSSRLLSWLMYSQIEARVCGSSPTVGSSRNSTCGACSRPRAISRRRFMPPEYVMTRLSRRSHRPTISITCRIRGHAVQGRVEAQVLRTGEVVVQRGVLEDQAYVASHRVALRTHLMTRDP